jgi:hypothetical protein
VDAARTDSPSPTCANFVAAYAPMRGTPLRPTIDDMMKRWPAPVVRKWRTAARAAWKVPK